MTTGVRPWHPADASALCELNQDAELARQLGGTFNGLDAAERHLREVLVMTQASRQWAIIFDGTVVGNVGVSAIEHRNDTGWASYWLCHSARGRGLAARALITAASDAFSLGVHRLELGHRSNNPASCRVALRAGFVVEGLERDKLRYGDERFDVETHARLSTDPSPELDGLPILTAR